MNYSASVRHLELEQILMAGRRLQNLNEDLEDAILDEMELLWYQMSLGEREESDKRVASYHAGLTIEIPIHYYKAVNSASEFHFTSPATQPSPRISREQKWTGILGCIAHSKPTEQRRSVSSLELKYA